MQKRTILNNEKGVSLLEVMVAMIILGVSLLMLLSMTMVALDGNDWANNTTRSSQLMQEKLEQLRSFDSLTDGTDTVDKYVRNWAVTSIASHLKRIDVDISWEDLRNVDKADTMTAYIQSDSV